MKDLAIGGIFLFLLFAPAVVASTLRKTSSEDDD